MLFRSQKIQEIYGQLSASNKRKAQVQRDAAIATAAALPPGAAREAIKKHNARRKNGQEPNGEAKRDSGNGGAPSSADSAGAHPQSANKRNREADTENPKRAVKTHRGGHSFNAVTPGRNHEAHSATSGARTAMNRRGSLFVSVDARGRGNTSTSNHPPRDGFQEIGRAHV